MEKLHTCAQEKMKHNLRSRVRSAIVLYNKRDNSKKDNNKTIKSSLTMNLIGCSVEFLKQYLESKFQEGMSWDNYGHSGWHIDHIKPCSSFDLSNEEEQKKCFHYTNLQPLWWYENLSKGAKLDWKKEDK